MLIRRHRMPWSARYTAQNEPAGGASCSLGPLGNTRLSMYRAVCSQMDGSFNSGRLIDEYRRLCISPADEDAVRRVAHCSFTTCGSTSSCRRSAAVRSGHRSY